MITNWRKYMKLSVILLMLLTLNACGNPGGISDGEYKKYKELGAPKILYTCTRSETYDPVAAAECRNKYAGAETILDCLKETAKRKIDPITDVSFSAGIGSEVTYNKLLTDAKKTCSGEFKVIDSKS
jgi:hypothetical protein